MGASPHLMNQGPADTTLKYCLIKKMCWEMHSGSREHGKPLRGVSVREEQLLLAIQAIHLS